MIRKKCNLSITTWSIGMHGNRLSTTVKTFFIPGFEKFGNLIAQNTDLVVYENFLNVTCKISFKWYICEDSNQVERLNWPREASFI